MRATRACKRGRGPAKQAQPLPMANLPQVSQQMAPVHPQGPQFPARATLVTSWWLLREIEASNAEIDHVDDCTDGRLVHWRLPAQKLIGLHWEPRGLARVVVPATFQTHSARIMHCLHSVCLHPNYPEVNGCFQPPQGSKPPKPDGLRRSSG